MKNKIILLLVLLFASCTEQEVYEFRQEKTHTYDKSYDLDKNGRDIKIIRHKLDFKAFGTDKFFRQSDYIRKNFILKRQDIDVKEWVEINFTPIDEDGFCFYTFRGNISRDDKATDRYVIDNERIVKVSFIDEHQNILFTFPFKDSYDTERRKGNYDIQGKTKLVTRALLERVIQEKIQIDTKFDWEWNNKFPRKTIDLRKLDFSESENNSSK